MQPIIKINLDHEEIKLIDIPEDWKVDYLGGASLGARIIYDYLSPGLDPLSSEMPILFLPGLLTGTLGPSVGRFVVCGRSPATNLWGESNCGGFWGPELRKVGFDGVWIEGKADKPVYLWIKNGHVEIRDARHLWGLDTDQAKESIHEELKNRIAHIAIIAEQEKR